MTRPHPILPGALDPKLQAELKTMIASADMSKRQLEQLADEHDVDLDGCKNNPERAAAINQAVKEQAKLTA